MALLLLAQLLLLPAAAVAAGRQTMAVLPAGTVAGIREALTVTEDLLLPNSPTVFLGDSGLRFELSKSAEAQTAANASALWGDGDPKASAVLNEDADLLGNALLYRGGGVEPSYDEIAVLAPPLLANLQSCDDYELTGQTFIGSRVAAEKRSFDWTGNMNNLDIRQRKHLDEARLKQRLNATFVGLLGGFQPAIRWYWPLDNEGWVEQTAFAVPESSEDQAFDVSSPQPIWVRYMNVSENGTLLHHQYVNTFEQYPYYCRNTSSDGKAGGGGGDIPSPACDGQNAVEYYAALLRFALYWNHTFVSEGSMELNLPKHGIDTAAFAKHSVARIMITRRDMYHPRYGAPPLYYASCCDGFQDVFAADMAVFLEWGLMPSAAGVLDNFFTFYMRRNAVVNYRGPEMAQYGRTLTLVAQYYRLSGGDPSALVLKHRKKITDISDMLLSRRRIAQALPRTDPSYGLIRGEDESDEMFSAWSQATSELPHFSFSFEAWRGFLEIGHVWAEVGAHCDASIHEGCESLVGIGEDLLKEADLLLPDIQRAMNSSAFRPPATATAGEGGAGTELGQAAGATATATSSTTHVVGGEVCHPYVAGEPYCADMDTANVSHTRGPYNGRASEPWRSYSGMFYSGGVTAQTAQEIVDYNQNHSKLSHFGIWGGVGSFRNQIMSFTEQGHGYGLVQHGLVEPFLLQLFSEMAHDCTRGSWTCFESRGIPNYTPDGGYTEASQSIVPLHTKWMLVFESPPTSSTDLPSQRPLSLAKATPRAWMANGETISVTNAPTSRGRVSFSVVSKLGSPTRPRLLARVALNSSFASGRGDRGAAAVGFGNVTLTLRVPAEWAISGATVGGQGSTAFDAQKEEIDLTAALEASAGSAVDVVVDYAKRKAKAKTAADGMHSGI